MMENSKGREAQTLQSGGHTYNDYGDPGNSDDPDNTGKAALPNKYEQALLSEFKIQPSFVKEGFSTFKSRLLNWSSTARSPTTGYIRRQIHLSLGNRPV